MAINFAPRPTENSDPWYRVRETYDESIESGIRSVENANLDNFRIRGLIPDGSNIDDFRIDHIGIWRISGNSDIQGTTPFSITSSSVFEVISTSASNGVKQVITDMRQSWWREANFPDTWGSWRKYVDDNELSTEQGRIDDLTSDLSTERGRIDDLTSDLSTERGRIDDLTSDLSTERGRIDDLVDRVDVLEATSYLRREVLPTRTNLNTVVEPGIYTLLQSSDYSQIPTNLAHSNISAILEVKRGADSVLGATQEITHSGYRYYRTINNFGNRTWRPWRRIAIETEDRVHIVGGYGSDPYGETEGGYGFSSEVV